MTKLTIGDLISGTVQTMEANRHPVILFVAVLSIVGTAFEWGLGAGTALIPTMTDDFWTTEYSLGLAGAGIVLGVLAILILTFIANYLLFEAMLYRQRLPARREASRRIIAFVALTILTYIGMILGLILFILPGVLIGARWAIAPAFLIDWRCKIAESLSQSWNAVRGNTTPVILTYIIGLVLVGVFSGIVGGAQLFAGSAEQPGLITIFGGQLVTSLGAALQIAFAVCIYSRLVGLADDLGNVFD